MANNLWRDQPSGRISTADLLTKMPSGVSQLVASEFFEAPAQAGVTASVALVEAADSLSSSGTVTSAPVLITVSLVEAGDSLASTGAALVGSTAAITEAADVLTVQSTVAVGATAALSQGADTVSSAALIAARCTAALIEANDTLAAQSGVSVGATSSLTESADTVFSNGSVNVSAITGLSESSDVLVAIAGVVVSADATSNETGDALAAQAALLVQSVAVLSESSDTLAAIATAQSASALVSATATLNESSDTLAAQATAYVAGAVAADITLSESPDAISSTASIGDAATGAWTAWGGAWGSSWGSSWGESRAVEYAHSGYWRLFYYNLQEQALEARNKLSVVSAPYKKPIAPVKSSTRQLVQRRSLSKIVDNTEGEASTEPCIPKAPLKPIYRTKNLIDRVELAQYLQPIVYELGGLVAVAKTSKAALEAEASVFDSEAIALLLLAA